MENKKSKLAINGGKPIMDKEQGRFIHPIITPNIEKAIIDQAHKTLSIYDRSGIFKEFEDDFAKYHNREHALLTSSGTAALWSLYDSIGLRKGDEVICPIYTFHATVSPLLQTGAKPIFIDCDETGNIAPQQIESKINKNTKAIMITHMWGYPCDMDKISVIAKKHGLYLFEDCSHAHGAEYKGQRIGSFGDASAFSLQGNKIITGGEGGIITTNNYEIYKNCILHGHYNKRCKQEIDQQSADYKFAVTGKGLKLRAHPLAIRIAHEQFKDIDNINAKKQEFADLIGDYVADIDGIELNKGYKNTKNSYYALILKLQKEKFGVDIKQFNDALIAEGGIEFDIPNSTAPLDMLPLFNDPSHFFPSYDGENLIKGEFPTAKKFSQSIIKMPVWHREEDRHIVENYGEILRKVSKEYEK